ncbi:MAG: NEAT domain-containing protein [Clostridia bacterium]|nr:NEAT domain-containing protein [Clostridia bacterium]
MKKIVALFLFLVLSVVPFSLCANAVDISDGKYEVPVVLMHKEDEKESFGNKYVAQTALLEVENGKKTVTILLTTDMKGIEFSYYINGTLEGEAAEGTPVNDITVKGEKYEQGFEIPVMADGDIGLKFSVPVMPMSPSARLRIDYANAVAVTENEAAATGQTTTAAATTTALSTTQAITSTTPTTTAAVTTTEASTVATTVATTVAATAQTSAPATTLPATETAAEQHQSQEESKSSSSGETAVMIVIAVVASAVAVFGFDRKKENKNNDDK